VDRVALLVRVDEGVVSDGAKVDHDRSYVLHGVPPSSDKDKLRSQGNYTLNPGRVNLR
jgi:hypothetical protein